MLVDAPVSRYLPCLPRQQVLQCLCAHLRSLSYPTLGFRVQWEEQAMLLAWAPLSNSPDSLFAFLPSWTGESLATYFQDFVSKLNYG